MRYIHPIYFYKLSRALARYRVPVLPYLLDLLSRLIFGCWIPHTTAIGTNVVLGYAGLGIVLHKDCSIGDRVHIDQHVTLGGSHTRYGVPTIGNDVYIGAGAKILGAIHIGDGAMVGANAVVTKDVVPGDIVGGVPAVSLKRAPL